MPLDHYISQVYLKQFLSPVLHNLMYAIRKSDLREFTPNSQSVCQIEDGSTNAYLREDRLIEEFLSSIEPKYNAALEKLMEDQIDRECIYTIAGFLAYFSSCSPGGMRIHSELLKHPLETAAKMMDARGLLSTSPPELGGETITELLDSGELHIKIDPKYPQAIGIDGILKTIVALGNFKWEVLHNDFPETPFFTSDFPVAIEESEDWQFPNRIIPLSPHTCSQDQTRSVPRLG